MRVLWCVLTAALMSGCFEAEDGQFLCDDGRCPEGTRCFDGVCLVDSPDVDAGETDGGLDAQGSDADANDGGTDGALGDVGPEPDTNVGAVESCSPNEFGAAIDEDGDGAIDEECPWFFGEPHLVEGANLAEGSVFALAFGASRDVAYLSAHTSDVPVHEIRRANVHLAFTADTTAVPLMGTQPPLGMRNSTVTVSADELLLVAQSTTLVAWTRPSVDDRFLRVDLGLPGGDAVHPTLSPNGLELYYAAESPRRIFRVARSARDLGFGSPVPVAVGDGGGAGSVHFPRMSSDGFTLFFTNQRGIEAATRDSLSDPFVGGERLSADLPATFISPTYLPDLREMWLIAIPGVPWSAPDDSVWRVEVCRDEPCEDEAPPTCEGMYSHFSCYYPAPSLRGWGGASTSCANSDGELTSISSVEEFALLRSFGPGNYWVGMNRVTPPDFAWASGEPLLYVPWNGGAPTAGANMECVVMSGNTLLNQACSTNNAALCERRQLPRWIEDRP